MMKCHYEVLGVEQSATDDELKKAYRRMARQLHPDKNRGNEEEATQQFQLVQAAYAVLSDPQERAWYDKHREAILRWHTCHLGVDVMPYFSTTAFTGYDDSPQGFYTVYRELFQRIVEDEQAHHEALQRQGYSQLLMAFGDLALHSFPGVHRPPLGFVIRAIAPADWVRKTHGGDGAEGVDVMPYFSTTAFTGYDDSPQGFYTVYRELFQRIVEDEQLIMKLSSDKDIPSFGDSRSNVQKVVRPFYKHWDAFTTRRHFHSCDKWDLRDAPNRRVRRLMEKENKKLRATAKKEYVATVRQLVRFVKKRDKRYQRYLEEVREQRERAQQEEQRRQEAKEKRLAEERARQEERLVAQAQRVMADREDDLSALDAYFDQQFGA
ncbi:hypothetical protein PTSG_12963 [Salpingoeca rosetta]|uniref:J domain-containing protein n=1 Tax=Salpingoeca rosetta (strain ATCC 50818 / BSB-021) TaxID=946362 RepID=F2UNL3_SALR5|nr:uncharacterized protein PTSG_12963 [Salpingoeca rosetta]EGD79218.1 hypothetical protein PTSG_12963 [Salpingoeca rosetta]|eukprot:XP_004989303.1 hypothetical protein PTSG_12963 [Salpingoeca rosetta]